MNEVKLILMPACRHLRGIYDEQTLLQKCITEHAASSVFVVF